MLPEFSHKTWSAALSSLIIFEVHPFCGHMLQVLSCSEALVESLHWYRLSHRIWCPLPLLKVIEEERAWSIMATRNVDKTLYIPLKTSANWWLRWWWRSGLVKKQSNKSCRHEQHIRNLQTGDRLTRSMNGACRMVKKWRQNFRCETPYRVMKTHKKIIMQHLVFNSKWCEYCNNKE